MNPLSIKTGKAHILYDADALDHIEEAMFDPEWWRQQGCMQGGALGRGTAWFVLDGQGRALVLRAYRRGGLPGKFIKRCYLWQGLEASRAFREWRLLARLHDAGLPVPAPLACRVQRHGLCYRAEILMQRLAAHSLAEHLSGQELPASQWQAIGRTLRQFHEHGVFHADLNARNILLADESEKIYLIDFDRGELRSSHTAWQQANLARLHRSLEKIHSQEPGLHFSESAWQSLIDGYYKYKNAVE